MNLVHVPYSGGAPAITDLVAGHVQVIFAPVSESIQQIKAGKLRALAVTTATRLDVLPDVPTVADFVPGYEASGFAGIGAPRNTPADIIDLLNKELNAGLADAKVKARIVELGGTVVGRHARGIRDDPHRGHRKVGEGDQVRGHQGRIGRSDQRWCVQVPNPEVGEPLFDHLVGAREQRSRDGEAQSLCGFQVDHQVEPGGLPDRQIGRLGSLQDPVDIAGIIARARETGIRQQASCPRIGIIRFDRRQIVPQCQFTRFGPIETWLSKYGMHLLAGYRGESGFKVEPGYRGLGDLDAQPFRRGRGSARENTGRTDPAG